MTPNLIRRLLVTVGLVLCLSSSALAADIKLAVVDFQEALNQTNDGATAMARLEGMRDEKMRSIEKKRQALASMQAELQNQSAILSESARAAKEEAFLKAQAEFQQLAMQSEQELQATYMGMMDDLVNKLRDVAAQIGKERKYNLVVEASGVVYYDSVDDITAELVTRYNAQSPKK